MTHHVHEFTGYFGDLDRYFQRGRPACTTSCFKPQLLLSLPYRSLGFTNHSQALGVVVVDFRACMPRNASRIPIIPNPTTPPILHDRAHGRLQHHGNRRRARIRRASRSRASRTSGVGAARRTAGLGDGGYERAGSTYTPLKYQSSAVVPS